MTTDAIVWFVESGQQLVVVGACVLLLILALAVLLWESMRVIDDLTGGDFNA